MILTYVFINTWRAEHRRKIPFSLEEKEIGRVQNEKSKEYFSVVWRGFRAVAGLASLLGVLLKKIGSNFRIADRTLACDFKNAFKIAEKYHAEALCAEATSFNFAECKTWRRRWDSNPRVDCSTLSFRD